MAKLEAQEPHRAEPELDTPLARASAGVEAIGQLAAAGLTPERQAEAQQILREVNERLDRIREVLLPPALGPSPEPAAEPKARPPRARVLVVDDDSLVARSIQRMLGHEHDVTVELGAREALSRLQGGERFDVVLCDVMMPEMSGPDFHAELVRTLPDQARRLVFVTGGAFTSDVAGYLDRSGAPKLEKPFDAEVLAELVAGYLRDPR